MLIGEIMRDYGLSIWPEL